MAIALPTRTLDRLAIGLSGLCLVHCLATTVLLVALASAGHALGAPWIHKAGLGLAMLLAGVALGAGIRQHGKRLPLLVGGLGIGVMAVALSWPHNPGEAPLTMAGVVLVAFAHRLNRSGS